MISMNLQESVHKSLESLLLSKRENIDTMGSEGLSEG